MTDQNLDDTQPTRLKKSPEPSQPSSSGHKRFKFTKKTWLYVAAFCLVLGLSVILTALLGYSAGKRAYSLASSEQAQNSLQEQFVLALEDIQAGRYDVARQRLEFILSQDPNYPGVADQLVEVMQVLYATATPTLLPPTITPTPTRDPRPLDELFLQAADLAARQEWDAAIDLLVTLRKEDRSYQVARVDGLLYISLRSRGVRKILQEANLEGGLYDLALAERFGPLDVDASTAGEWARLYITGLSFWEVHPELAVYYFGQVANAAPYLRDASGFTAIERYRAVLIQYGDLLASQNKWCDAQTQYALAASIRNDATLQALLENAALQCLGPTPTQTATLSSETPTPTATLPFGTPTPTFTIPAGTTTAPTATSTVLAATPTATRTQPGQNTQVPTTTATPVTPQATQVVNTPTATQPAATPTVTDTINVASIQTPSPLFNLSANATSSNLALFLTSLAGMIAFLWWSLVSSGGSKR